jgi:hypothetical protein
MDSQAAAQAKWRDSIVRNPAPDAGCFHASYPGTAWEAVDCGPPPTRLYRPRGASPPRETVDADAD